MLRRFLGANLLWLPALLAGCGGESRNPLSAGAGHAGVSGGHAVGVAGAAGGVDSVGEGVAGAAGECGRGAEPPPFATWPMPNPVASGLPNPSSYHATRPGVVFDETTGLAWEANPGAAMLSAPDAAQYCADLRLDDRCDWRMPSRIELVSLVDFTRRDPALDAALPVTSGDFLTSSTVEDFRWRVGSDGATRVLSSSLSTMARVRCVRTQVAHPPEEPRYAVVGEAPDDAVTDRGTGLSWQRRPSSATYTFAEASDYCAGLALVGGGFRVPSMKELQTVLDEQAPSYVDPDVFPDYPATQNPTFWTSTLSARGPENAWFVRGGWTLNVAIDAGVDAKFYVRCVK
jgi:hypothetical protein